MKGASVPVSYRLSWDDGFGARGWKLDCSIGEASVIAATAETGCRIGTSVLVHDLLDHYLCGVGIGGHRNEAIALVQLAERTGSDPTPDILQIIEEDLLIGHVNGESMHDFLPVWLIHFVPSTLREGASIIQRLEQRLGRETLREALLDHFLALGTKGAQQARRNFERHELEYFRRAQMGFCLQSLLKQADEAVVKAGTEKAAGKFLVGNETCSLMLNDPPLMYQASLFP
jgi:hypothetical protein